MRLGQDPIKFLDQGNEDFLISQAIVSVAREEEQKEKVEELKALSSRTAYELAKVVAPLFR
jgi:phosphosulfolactate phosphohydrolase-like enzyme